MVLIVKCRPGASDWGVCSEARGPVGGSVCREREAVRGERRRQSRRGLAEVLGLASASGT